MSQLAASASHRARVCSLYKQVSRIPCATSWLLIPVQALVTQRNWAIDRDTFNSEALKACALASVFSHIVGYLVQTQAAFRSRMGETNQSMISEYVAEAERMLAHYRHPDP